MLRTLAFSTALALGSAAALAGTPRVNSLYPSAGQRGTEIEVRLAGSNLADSRDLLFNTPGFSCTAVKAEGNNFVAKIKIAPDAAIGEHVFRVVTASGIADTRLFYVTPFPMVEEKAEDPKTPNALQPVALGTTVYGKTPGEDQDHFEVEVKKGQRLSVEIIGFQIQTQTIYDAYLTITKPDGTPLAEVDDTPFGRANPVATVIAPEDGKLQIHLKDSTNSGPGECHYLMHVGSFPRPVVTYPGGGPVGSELKVQLLGDASGPREKTVKLPAEAQRRFPLFDEDAGQQSPTPNFIRVSPFPNVLEAEPNNDVATATKAEALPVAFNGILQEKGDGDIFRFPAKKGQAFDLNVYGRELRSPIDPVLNVGRIVNNAPQHIAGNDDSGKIDSYLSWAAPDDGEFYVQVLDQLGRGGPLYAYRVEIKPKEAHFATWLPEMTINSSQDRRALPVPKGNRYATQVKARRAEVGGDFTLGAAGLPAGVTATPIVMEKSVDTVPMVFEAAADAAPAQGHATITAKSADPNLASLPARVEHNVEVSENGNRRAFYAVQEDSLPIAVTDEIPVKIELAQPKVPIIQNGQMALKVRAERKGDFKGAINLALLYAPPGIGSAGTQPIPEGQNEGTVTISANGNAPLQKWKVCVVGSANFGKGDVWFSTALVDLEIAPAFVQGGLVRTFVDQGDQATMTLKLDQKVAFDGKATITLTGFPNDVSAETREITKDDKEVKFTLKAGAGAPPGSHRNLFCSFLLTKDGEPMTYSFGGGGILRIDKASVAQK